MIYLDASVALAHLLVEDRRPPDSLWDETLVSSRLLQYELWRPLHARAGSRSLTERPSDGFSGGLRSRSLHNRCSRGPVRG